MHQKLLPFSPGPQIVCVCVCGKVLLKYKTLKYKRDSESF